MNASTQSTTTTRVVREVWAWNFNAEFEAFIAATVAEGAGALVAFDTEFPGCAVAGPWCSPRTDQYKALRQNVNLLKPIQLGVAVASADGVLRGVWSFNFLFNVAVDLHTEKAVKFLTKAGINFFRHSVEGVDPQEFGRRLAKSPLVRFRSAMPTWVTFAGMSDLGYLLKLLSAQPLPRDAADFDKALAFFCPKRQELRDRLPYGSLESLVCEHDLRRNGTAHTAGSDAIATLDLFLHVVPIAQRAVAEPVAHPEEEKEKEASAAPAFRPPPGLPPPSDAEKSKAQLKLGGAALQQKPSGWGVAAREVMIETNVAKMLEPWLAAAPWRDQFHQFPRGLAVA